MVEAKKRGRPPGPMKSAAKKLTLAQDSDLPVATSIPDGPDPNPKAPADGPDRKPKAAKAKAGRKRKTTADKAESAGEKQTPAAKAESAEQKQTLAVKADSVEQKQTPADKVGSAEQKQTPAGKAESVEQKQQTPAAKAESAVQKQTLAVKADNVEQKQAPADNIGCTGQKQTPAGKTESAEQKQTPAVKADNVVQKQTPADKVGSVEQKQTPAGKAESIEQKQQTPASKAESAEQKQQTPSAKAESVKQRQQVPVDTADSAEQKQKTVNHQPEGIDHTVCQKQETAESVAVQKAHELHKRQIEEQEIKRQAALEKQKLSKSGQQKSQPQELLERSANGAWGAWNSWNSWNSWDLCKKPGGKSSGWEAKGDWQHTAKGGASKWEHSDWKSANTGMPDKATDLNQKRSGTWSQPVSQPLAPAPQLPPPASAPQRPMRPHPMQRPHHVQRPQQMQLRPQQMALQGQQRMQQPYQSHPRPQQMQQPQQISHQVQHKLQQQLPHQRAQPQIHQLPQQQITQRAPQMPQPSSPISHTQQVIRPQHGAPIPNSPIVHAQLSLPVNIPQSPSLGSLHPNRMPMAPRPPLGMPPPPPVEPLANFIPAPISPRKTFSAPDPASSKHCEPLDAVSSFNQDLALRPLPTVDYGYRERSRSRSRTPTFRAQKTSYLPAPVYLSVKVISPTLSGLMTEGFHNQQFNGDYHCVVASRVQKGATFWRRPNLDVFMHSYPPLKYFLALSLRGQYEKATGDDHQPPAYQAESTQVWLESVTIDEIKSISISGFEKNDINGEYNVREGTPVQGNPIFWNGKRSFFAYFQANFDSRLAIAPENEYDDARLGDTPAFAYVLPEQGWQEHDGHDWRSRPSIVTTVKWKHM